MQLPELAPSPALTALIASCETACTHECCGIDAFIFSPLNVAMHLMPGGYGGVDPERVRAARAGLDELERSAQALPADTFGRICSIAGTNQYFSMPSLTELIARLRWAISVAPQVIACSDELVREYARRSANGRG